ncbi:hypothetical protein [Rhizobium aethiopicum]|uniref:Uncharacterized protein n=1 Tax=Rhizobium aethiopicum TaxID=1138170 RepID=A0A7W6Q7Z6_9HYPH|nr:hypothetical protein [Rhizobium aethiopicum]MBB4192795.1 hypothetical protein [Rhizobium aethiopicum]
MAWAVFHEEVHWSRPGSRLGFHARAKPEPQSFPHDFVDYAVSIGRATKTKPPRRQILDKFVEKS